jgi:hypothetical protein
MERGRDTAQRGDSSCTWTLLPDRVSYPPLWLCIALLSQPTVLPAKDSLRLLVRIRKMILSVLTC